MLMRVKMGLFVEMMRKDLPQVVVPKTYHKNTSRKFLSTGWIEGEKLSQSTESDVGELVNVSHMLPKADMVPPARERPTGSVRREREKKKGTTTIKRPRIRPPRQTEANLPNNEAEPSANTPQLETVVRDTPLAEQHSHSPSPSVAPVGWQGPEPLDTPTGDETGPIPGGPIDESVLCSFRTHVAHALWSDPKARGMIKCHNHGNLLKQWPLIRPDGKDNSIWRAHIEKSGLLPLRDCAYRWCNMKLICAFVERWHPETNTFHMPFGEMSISLDDVHSLLGISVTGKAVSTPPKDSGLYELLKRTLGLTVSQSQQYFQGLRGYSVKLKQLREDFSDATDKFSPERIAQCARAYLLYLVGCTIFTDKTGTRVPVLYPNLFEDLEKVHQYSWGSAALASLYYQMRMASKRDGHSIAGFLTLLEAWVYEHFPNTFDLRPNMRYLNTLPRAQAWEPKDIGQSIPDLQVVREKLDDLQADQVTWDPYASLREYHPFQQITFYKGCLKGGDVIEPYQPDRFLRQFGYVQSIPRVLVPAKRANREFTSQPYNVLYEFIDSLWDDWENHTLAEDLRTRRATYPSEVDPNYLEWFMRTSHVRVVDPNRRTSPPLRPTPPNSISDERIGQMVALGEKIVNMGSEEAIRDPHQLFSIICQMVDIGRGESSAAAEGTPSGSTIHYQRTRSRSRNSEQS